SSRISIILERKISKLLHPHGAGFELRLARQRIAGADREIVRRLEKSLVAAPVKRQKAGALDDFLGDPRLGHHFAAARDDLDEIGVLHVAAARVAAVELQ